jgi:plastocyanin
MKKILFFVLLLASSMGAGFAAKYTVTNAGTAFSPTTLTIEVGEDVEFVLGSSHNAVEVTKETWDANGNTAKSGGFSVPFGGGDIVFPTAGTYYFVCQPHAALGMKMTIIVGNASTAIPSVTDNISSFTAFPDPASENITVSYTLNASTFVTIRLFNTVGVEVASILNESQVPGQYRNTYSLNRDLPSGLYFVRINSENQSYTNKLLLK